MLFKMELAICCSCMDPIHDRSYLLVGTRKWHARCLTCNCCSVGLSSDFACYEKNSKVYCKECYFRLFCAIKCSSCQKILCKSDLVMQAKNYYYHVDCFCCSVCSLKLTKGHKFGLHDTGLLCEQHYIELNKMRRKKVEGNIRSCAQETDFLTETLNLPAQDDFQLSSPSPDFSYGARNNTNSDSCANPSPCSYNSGNGIFPFESLGTTGDNTYSSLFSQLDNNKDGVVSSPKCEFTKITTECGVRLQDRSLSVSSLSSAASNDSEKDKDQTGLTSTDGRPLLSSDGRPLNKKGKPKRIRTSFKNSQLQAMKDLFDVDKNPDSYTLNKLSKEIDLSKRVLQVWFQNARAKHRKESGSQPGNDAPMNQSDEESDNLQGLDITSPTALPKVEPLVETLQKCSDDILDLPCKVRKTEPISPIMTPTLPISPNGTVSME